MTGPGAPVTVSPAGPVTTGVDGNGASPFTITQVSSAGSKVHLAETHQDGFTDGAVSCTNGASGSSGAADVTVKPGDNVVCTFHNTANRASISVVKLVDDKGASGWDVDRDGAGCAGDGVAGQSGDDRC